MVQEDRGDREQERLCNRFVALEGAMAASTTNCVTLSCLNSLLRNGLEVAVANPSIQSVQTRRKRSQTLLSLFAWPQRAGNLQLYRNLRHWSAVAMPLRSSLWRWCVTLIWSFLVLNFLAKRHSRSLAKRQTNQLHVLRYARNFVIVSQQHSRWVRRQTGAPRWPLRCWTDCAFDEAVCQEEQK